MDADAQPRPRHEPSFAIAFGGGGARGLAHIHVIEALDELGIRPVAISGSSIGAIMGAGMAAGMSGRDIRDYTHSVLSRRAEVASRMWKARPGSFVEMMQGGLKVSQFNIERILGAFLPVPVPATFEELKIPLAVATTDFYGHCMQVLSAGELPSALAASAAIPAVFQPVIRQERVLIDGGISNPLPFDLVMGLADIVIAVDVVGVPAERGKRRPNTIDLLFGANQIMQQSIIAAKLDKARPHVLLKPPVSRFRVLDFLKIDAVMRETAAIKDETKRAVEEAVARFARR